uniref:Enhancer of mRNA-decapping protein 3 n=1 Tax=Ornithodoros turicata TaxID=34597 RepID=A0A2R5L5S8_9ACAR
MEWVGCIVVVDCGAVLGTYQGKIVSVDPQKQLIVLAKATRNGATCSSPDVTISAQDIVDLNIIEASEETSSNGSTVNVQSGSSLHTNADADGSRKESRKKQTSTPKKCESNSRKNAAMRERDEACFSTPVDSDVLEKDFDFEKNLALFDKRAVFNEIEATMLRPGPQSVPKYRCDENVLGGGEPTVLRQITVPCPCDLEYVTDTGLVVPSVTVELRDGIVEACERFGYLWPRQLEMLGRASAEMVIQLLGGCHRLDPQNSHQRPTVLVVCGAHRQGTQVICCGRHLANHGIRVILLAAFVQSSVFATELSLFKLSGGKVLQAVADLANYTVDIVLSGLDGPAEALEPVWTALICAWVRQSKASVLVVDPPADRAPTLCPKWVLMPLLPLAIRKDVASSAGLYLCDIGVPKAAFKELGVQYASPFGSKFVIPLHARTAS